MVLFSICCDFYDCVSKFATDLSFEAFVVAYSFGIKLLPNLFLNNLRSEVM
jgi:hypothetical protein